MRNPFLDVLDPQLDTGDQPATFWATVVGTSPLRIQRDSELTLPITPKTLEAVQVGDRVLCLWERRQVIVLGRMGGPHAPPEPPPSAYPQPNRILIDGTSYLMSGSVVVPSFTWSHSATPVFSTTVAMPIPYNPPFPYTFNWSMQESAGFSHAANGDRFPSGGTQNVRLLQLHNSSTTTIKRLQWQLVNA